MIRLSWIWRAGFVGMLCQSWLIVALAAEGEAVDLGFGYTREGQVIRFEERSIELEGKHDLKEFAKAVGHELKLCTQVDAKSFVALSKSYSKDKNHVYYRWISPGRFWIVEVPNADPQTFQALDWNLAKDAKHVWQGDWPIAGADGPTAEVVTSSFVWKDRNRVYYQWQVMQDADPKTFRHLDQGYYRDAQRVYWCNELLTADPPTFETYGNVPYAKDRRHVWAGAKVLKEVDAESFQFLCHGVYKDATRVYVGIDAEEMVGADAASFELVEELDRHTRLFRDRDHYYLFELGGYQELYAMKREGEVIAISKPIWRSTPRLDNRFHAANISAELKDGLLSMPQIEMMPGYKKQDRPIWEKDKLRNLRLKFIAAEKRIPK